MITIEQCKLILNDPTLTDQEVEQIRGLLYALCEEVVNKVKLN